MAFLQANIHSNILRMEVDVNIILLQETVKKVGIGTQAALTGVPVSYSLHRMGGSHSVWVCRTSIEQYVADLGVAVIILPTDSAWYTDTQYDTNYWTLISEELSKICHQLFPQLSTKREETFAAGLSMGGYDALKLRLTKLGPFAAVISLFGAISLSSTSFGEPLRVRKRGYWEGIFGPLD